LVGSGQILETITASDTEGAEAAVVRKAARKLLPLLFLCYVVACLDRSNIGVAALTMMSTLELNSAQFGVAAGIFFLGYCAGGLPSNLLQVHYGPRRWIGRLLIVWGIVACGMALVIGPRSLYGLRVLLGLAEAGFLPGAVTYLAFWFPATYRARAFALFTMAIPASMVLGTPLSAALLYMDGLGGLHGWQWLFVIEGLPAVLLGFVCLHYLPNSPRDAAWFSEPERALLSDTLAREHRKYHSTNPGPAAPIQAALMDGNTWHLGLIGVGLAASSYGVIFFSPQIIAGFAKSHLETGLLSALPFFVALIAMFFWSRHSDQMDEQRMHIAIPFGIAALGLVVLGVADSLWLKMVGLIAACAGSYMSTPPFLQVIPRYFQKGSHAAAGTAIITTILSIAGFFMPALIGYLKLLSGNYRSGLVSAAAVVACSGLLALRLSTPTEQRA